VQFEFAPALWQLRLGVIIGAISAVLISRLNPTWIAILAAALLIWPRFAEILFRGVFYLAALALHAVNLLLLTVVYFTLITPMAVLHRRTRGLVPTGRQPGAPADNFTKPY
jgi:hypothetical protein